MVSEGQFPKETGDILYASEANLFFNSQRTWKTGSTGYVSSGADYQEVGSIFFSSGTLPNPCTFIFRGLMNGNSERVNGQVVISGTTGSAYFGWTAGSNNQNLYADCWIGTGVGQAITMEVEAGQPISQGMGAVTAINPQLDTALLFKLNVMGAGSSRYASYSVGVGGSKA